MSMTRWDPYRRMMTLREAMNRMFDESFYRPYEEEDATTQRGAIVPLDMYETEDEYVLSAAMPGVKPEDVDISVTGNTMTIKGEFKQEETRERGDVHFQERRYGTFPPSTAVGMETCLTPSCPWWC